jgi:hypothetical protein
MYTDAEIWPDAISRPSASARAEIRRVAEEITSEEVADSGLTFAPWYVKFYLAEGRVRQQQAQAPKTQEQRQVDRLQRSVADLERRLSAAEASCTKLRHFVFEDPGAGEDQLPPLLDVIARVAAKIRKELGQRLDTLEARPPSLTYRGVWKTTEPYAAGSAVTHAGSLWVALIASTGVRPGDGSASWQLAVKRGAAEKDGVR